MTDEAARTLVSTYVDGWRRNDTAEVAESLTSDCIITESHGPTYHGSEQVMRWIKAWFGTGNTINAWDINSFSFAGDTAFFEWSYTCTVDGIPHTLEGASAVQFKNEKIDHIREYRMTKPAFDYFQS